MLPPPWLPAEVLTVKTWRDPVEEDTPLELCKESDLVTNTITYILLVFHNHRSLQWSAGTSAPSGTHLAVSFLQKSNSKTMNEQPNLHRVCAQADRRGTPLEAAAGVPTRRLTTKLFRSSEDPGPNRGPFASCSASAAVPWQLLLLLLLATIPRQTLLNLDPSNSVLFLESQVEEIFSCSIL